MIGRAANWVLFALAWSFMWVTRPVATTTLHHWLAGVGGWLAWVLPGPRGRVAANLALVRPGMDRAARRAFTRATGAAFTRLSIEYSRLDRVVAEMRLTVTGARHLAHPKGLVLVSAHYGNWEAVRVAARAAGRTCGIIYRPFNNQALDRYTQRLIACAGAPVLHKGRAGMRALVAHVARGGAVLILVDQRNTGAPFLPFLGQPAETVTAAAELARRSGAALIPAVARRREDGGFDVTFEPPVPDADPAAMMAEVNARIGAWIDADPAQWFWFHRRWRTTHRSRAPEGGPGADPG